MNTETSFDVNEESFEYGKTYYIDKSGVAIEESEIKEMHSDCIPVVRACCRLQLPKGFKFAHRAPGMCFDLSDLSCVKSPMMQQITIPSCDKRHPMECEVVGGYEIRVVGDVHFSVSTPISPIAGFCYPRHSQTCNNTTAAVNEVVSYTCCPNPCPPDICCVDWCFLCFTVYREVDRCGPYLYVTMKLGLEYSGECECDEE